MNFREKPYFLGDEQIKWVEETLAQMTVREKVGQLFCINIMEEDVTGLINQLKKLDFVPGSFMTRSFKATTVQDNFKALQDYCKYPLLLAANLERGADGVCDEGTLFGTQMQVAATDDVEMSYQFGRVCGLEGLAVGANWNFGPILDIDYEFHNPITNTRVFSSEPDTVLEMTKAYVRGMAEIGMISCLKHWPGDGRDERDQHMVTSVNDCTVSEWDSTYGRIYKELIDMGAETVMSAHIMLPEYSRAMVPGIKDEDILPGSLSYELNNTLLRDKLGFNGLVVSDATTMNGFMQAMERKKAVPTCIANGVDMFLFALHMDEDFNFMLKGLEDGILTEERLDEAVTRILALKASKDLHRKYENGTMIPDRKALEVIGCEEHTGYAKACADQAITLVKDTQNLLPIDPKKTPKVLLHILGDVGGYHDFTRDHGLVFEDLLTKSGFEVTLFRDIADTFNYIETSIESIKAYYDLVIYFSNIKTSGSDTVARISWGGPGAQNAPRYLQEIPTLFISVDNPYHLMDVPHVKTYINGYTANAFVLESMIEKITGTSPFTGVNPIDPFCGRWEARL